jgi:hypothetical protein
MLSALFELSAVNPWILKQMVSIKDRPLAVIEECYSEIRTKPYSSFLRYFLYEVFKIHWLYQPFHIRILFLYRINDKTLLKK